MNWIAKLINTCGCGKCGGYWNVFKDDGSQITKQSEEHAKMIASAPAMKELLKRALPIVEREAFGTRPTKDTWDLLDAIRKEVE